MIKAIYKITNLINNKIYIGQSVHPEKRWKEHQQRAKTCYDDYPIHLAINKYGANNFSFEILEWTEDYDNEEKRLIQQLNTLSPNGYNIIDGGHSPIMIGEDHPRNTVSNNNVLSIICELKQNKLSDREIAIKYKVSDKVIADINHGYAHKIENEQYPIRIKKGRQQLSEKQVIEIKELLLNSQYSFTEIAQMYNTTKNNISQINNGRSFNRFGWTYPLRQQRVRPN